MKSSPLFRKAMLFALLVFGTVGNVTSLSSAWTLRERLTAQYEARATAIARAIASSTAEIFLQRDAATIQSIIDQFVESQGVGYVAVTSADGEIVAHTLVPRVPDEVRAVIASVHRQGELGGPGRQEPAVRRTGSFLDVSAPIMAGAAGRVHVGMDRQTLRRLVWPAIWRMQLITVALFAGAAAAIWLLVRSVTRPLAALTEYSRRAAAHDFSATIDIRRADEIGMLAQAMQSMAADLSERIRGLKTSVEETSQELAETSTYLRTIMGSLADGLVVVDEAGRISQYNPAFARLFDLPETGDGGRLAGPCVGPELERVLLGVLLGRPGDGADRPSPRVLLARTQGGREFPVEVGVSAVRVQDTRHAVAIMRDITDRRRAEEALRRARDELERRVEERTAELRSANLRLEREVEERREAQAALAQEKELLSVTLRSIGDAVVATDTAGTVVLLNPAAEALLGWPAAEARGKPFRAVFRSVDPGAGSPAESLVDRVLATGASAASREETLLVARDGQERYIADGAAPIFDDRARMVGVVLVFRDVTDRRRMEQELQRADKLESLGVLAGGIAHDFNNLLGAVLANLSLAKHQLGGCGGAWELIDEAEQASVRATNLTQQLLTFSRGGAPVKRVARLAPLVDAAVRFALRGSKVRYELEQDEDLWPAQVDEGQIGQVFHNLALNAVQAMPEGGVLRVTLRNAVVAAGTPLAPGRYVELRVRDEGRGMPEAVAKRAFDPYFTTKARGSGLGLAVVYSVVRSHGGRVELQSACGQGTTFTLHLPAATQAAEAPLPPGEDLLRGRGLVLVIDDEEGLRKVYPRILRYLGYDVAVAADGREGLDMYASAREGGRPFDLVILDLTIPGGLGGTQALDALRALDPGARIVASSGYAADPILADYRRHGFDGVLPKPFKAADLGRVVAEVLGRASPGGAPARCFDA